VLLISAERRRQKIHSLFSTDHPILGRTRLPCRPLILPPSPPAMAVSGDEESGGSSTRICVKNVPKHVDERRLRQHFGTTGQVTDARILRTKDGQSRKMAFVGFKTPAEAQAAVAYFGGTFLDTSRLVVEVAKPRGDDSLARPWSKHSAGSSRFQKAQAQAQGAGKRPRPEATGGKGSKGIKPRLKDHMEVVPDGEGEGEGGEGEVAAGQGQKKRRVDKEEFLAAMRPRSTTKFWANDDAPLPAPARTAPTEPASSSSDDDDDDGDDDDDDGDAMDEEGEGEAAPGSAGGMSDLAYLRSKVKKGLEEEVEAEDDDDDDEEKEEGGSGPEGDDDDDAEEEEGEKGKKPAARPRPPKATPKGQGVAQGEGPADAASEGEGEGEDSGRLFLRNLPFSASEEDVLEELGRFGRVVGVHLPVDETKRPKGFAFAQFLVPEDARRVSGWGSMLSSSLSSSSSSASSSSSRGSAQQALAVRADLCSSGRCPVVVSCRRVRRSTAWRSRVGCCTCCPPRRRPRTRSPTSTPPRPGPTRYQRGGDPGGSRHHTRRLGPWGMALLEGWLGGCGGGSHLSRARALNLAWGVWCGADVLWLLCLSVLSGAQGDRASSARGRRPGVERQLHAQRDRRGRRRRPARHRQGYGPGGGGTHNQEKDRAG
jgi:RNA recognition motif-containing protein